MLDHMRRLREIRIGAGLTQVQLASLLGVSQANVVRLEQHSESATLTQVRDWLRACGFESAPNAVYWKQLLDTPLEPIHSFLSTADMVIRCCGGKPFLYRKPLLVVSGNERADQTMTSSFLRTLLHVGETAFYGLLIPSPNMTILFKHVSTRPPGFDQAVYLLGGGLKPEMIVSPLDHLPVLQYEEVPQEGTTLLLEEDRPQTRLYGVGLVFLNHPLLRLVDVLRPAFRSDSIQGLFDVSMAREASVNAVCLRGSPTPRSMIMTMLAPEASTCPVLPIGLDSLAFNEMVETCGGVLIGSGEEPHPTRFLFDQKHLFNGGENTRSLLTLARKIQETDKRYSDQHRKAFRNNRFLPSRPMVQGRGPRFERCHPKGSLGSFIVQKLAEAFSVSDGEGQITAYHLMSAFEPSGNSFVNWELPIKKCEAMLAAHRAAMPIASYVDVAPDSSTTDQGVVDLLRLSWGKVAGKMVRDTEATNQKRRARQ